MKIKSEEIFRELFNILKDMNLEIPSSPLENMTEADETKPEEPTDDKLEQMLSDMEDTARLLHDKFRELSESDEQIIKINSQTEDEYNKIQSGKISDSIESIKNTMINLGRLYQYFTQYITKYGFKNINAKKEQPTENINENKKQELAKQIAKDFESFKPSGHHGDIEIDNVLIRNDFRDLGNWIHDEENSYDREDDWREDDDQEIWAPGEYKKYLKLFTDWAETKSWYKLVKISLQTSEKNWCEFIIEVK